MERTVVDAETPSPAHAVARRGLSGPLDTDGVALNHYRIPPGEGFPSGLHTHADQEEIFVVLEGVATFETLAGSGENENEVTGGAPASPRTGHEVRVEAGEAIRFAPGEYQSGYNREDEALVALAIGAPRESTDVRVPVRCPECGDADLGLDSGGERLSFVCPACDAERVPASCPDCGADGMGLTLDDANTVVAACESCGAEFETPPFRE